MTLHVSEHATPLGTITMATRNGRVCAMAFSDCWSRLERRLTRRDSILASGPATGAGDVAQRLDAYFAGDLCALEAIPVEALGTPFQRAVWNALCEIPAGSTAAYRDVARRLGMPSAVRAVGAAIGANPVWLAVPCHRAIGADGSLTGYAGGLDRKRWLLAHEGAAISGR
ncbi:MAG: methylated-DNA--[protein]-cysteine S-methyltransferase [Candidatus Binatia bacterium]